MNNPFRSGYNMPDNCFSTPYDEKVECQICHESFDECDMIFNEYDGEYYCEECYEEELFECPICGKRKLKDDNEHYEEDNNVLCDECYEDLKHL